MLDANAVLHMWVVQGHILHVNFKTWTITHVVAFFYNL